MVLVRLLVWTTLDLLVALLLSLAALVLHQYIAYGFDQQGPVLSGLQALGIPLRPLGLQGMYEREYAVRDYYLGYEFITGPASEDALATWLHQLPGLELEKVERVGMRETAGRDTNLVIVRCRGAHGLPAPAVPWEQFGYRPQQPSKWTIWVERAPRAPPLRDPEIRLTFMGWLQWSLLLVGAWRLWRNRRREAAPAAWAGLWGRGWFSLPHYAWESHYPPVLGEAPGRAFLSGLGAGLVLAVVLLGYTQALFLFVGPPGATASHWQCAPSLPWQTFPGPEDVWRVLVVVLIGVVAPLAEEIYFRGGLFALWAGAGRPWMGALLSTAAFALCRFDWYYLPLYLVLGLVLAGLYCRMRSLLAPLTAHLLVNGGILLVAFGLLPAGQQSVNRIVGTWERVNPPNSEALEFHLGGLLSGGSERAELPVTSKLYLFKEIRPLRYEFVNRDLVRVESYLRVQDDRRATWGLYITEEVEVTLYRVRLDGQELTLTDEKSGRVLTYRRVATQTHR